MTKQASNYFMPLSHGNLPGRRECAEHLWCLGSVKRVRLSQLRELGEASSERKDASLPLLGVTSIYSG